METKDYLESTLYKVFNFGDYGASIKEVLIDAGYENNTPFLKELEKRKLKYLGGVAKNRKIIRKTESGIEE